MNILFVSSLKKNSTSISILRALSTSKDCFVQKIISDVKNKDFPKALIRKGFFDIEKEYDSTTDVILFVEGGSFQLFPLNIDKCSVKTAWYGIDTHTNFEKHVAISRGFDISFIAQKEYVEKLRNYCSSSIHWLPLGFDNIGTKKDVYPQIQNDIAFVGSTEKTLHPARVKLIDIINEYDFRKYIGKASMREMYNIYKKSHCVFNYSINNDLNMRVFEAIGNGALLFTNEIRNNGLEDLFEEGSDYVLFTEETFRGDLERTINNLKKYKSMRQERIQKVERLHTYTHRMQELIKLIRIIELKKEKSSENQDEFDYIRIAFLNGAYKISLQLLLDLFIAKTQKKSFRILRKFFI